MNKNKKPGIKKKKRIHWGFLIGACVAIVLFIFFVLLGLYLGTLV